MSNLAFHAGDIVSNATLRTEDLIPAFYGALVQATYGQNDSGVFALKESVRGWLAMERNRDAGGSVQSYHDESGLELVSDLMDALNALAPDGTYFGANEGDGACFGFWQIED